MAKIKFMTDSAADIPPALLEEYDILMLSFPMMIDGKEYLDGRDFTPQEFYEFIGKAKEVPTHSQLTAFQFIGQYEKV